MHLSITCIVALLAANAWALPQSLPAATLKSGVLTDHLRNLGNNVKDEDWTFINVGGKLSDTPVVLPAAHRRAVNLKDEDWTFINHGGKVADASVAVPVVNRRALKDEDSGEDWVFINTAKAEDGESVPVRRAAVEEAQEEELWTFINIGKPKPGSGDA